MKNNLLLVAFVLIGSVCLGQSSFKEIIDRRHNGESGLNPPCDITQFVFRHSATFSIA